MWSEKSKGQTLSEYVLIGGFILIACIAALTLLGSSTAGMFTGFGDGLSKGQSSLAGSANGSSTPVSSDGGKFATEKVSLNLGGKSVTLDSYPSNIKNLVTTSGSNGATTVLANTMSKLVDELLASGEISQADADLLIRLSNQGHRLASMQKAVESAISVHLTDPGSQTGTFGAIPLEFEGQNLAIDTIGNRIGWEDTDDMTAGMDPFNSPGAGAEMQAFIDLYQQASKTGAMQNPATKAIVEDLSRGIIDISESFEQRINEYSNNKEMPVVKTDFDAAVGSNLTHDNSAGICDSGSGQDNGVSCSKQ